MVIPFCALLLYSALLQLWTILYLEDPMKKKLYYFDHKHKIISTIASCCTTICLLISILIAAFLIEQCNEETESNQAYLYSNNIDTKDIVQFVIIMAIFHVFFQIDIAGTYTLDILLE